ncbi:hypothetical protein L6452_37825 [Arctium lappa]|uniref:Uncharacterized protein n=1 Tax=Arctium lappa TaxID=4217 RepID=A0ACB8Y561_ARCLA|nr:hypothetical protein L6452_37825 [Arctium lappa]
MENAYKLTPYAAEPTHGYYTISPTIQLPPLLSAQTDDGPMLIGAMGSFPNLDAAIEHEMRMGTIDPSMDKKSMRRLISNRYAAKKSHVRKANRMDELEQNRRDLEDAIAILQPQIENERQFKSHLMIENEMLTKQLQIRIDLENLKQAQIAEKTKERQLLRGLLNM